MNRGNQAAKMAATIAKGKWHFIVWRGVIGWGLGTAVLFNLFMVWMTRDWSAGGCALAFVLFPIGGVFWGATMWCWLKMRFAEISESGRT